MRQSTDGAFFVLNNDQHAALETPPVSGAETVYHFDPKTQMCDQIDPVNATLEQGAAGYFGVIAPAPAVLPLCRVNMDESDLAECAGCDDATKCSGQGFVAVVLSHEHATAAPRHSTSNDVEVSCVQKCRLLDNDVLPVLEGAESEIQVQVRWRGDKNGVDPVVDEGRGI